MCVSVRLAQAVSFRVRETGRLRGAEREPAGQREDELRQEESGAPAPWVPGSPQSS